MHDRSTFKLALETFEVQRSLLLESPYNPYKLRAYAKISSVEEMMRWEKNVPTTERLTRLRFRERRWTLACLMRFRIYDRALSSSIPQTSNGPHRGGDGAPTARAGKPTLDWKPSPCGTSNLLFG